MLRNFKLIQLKKGKFYIVTFVKRSPNFFLAVMKAQLEELLGDNTGGVAGILWECGFQMDSIFRRVRKIAKYDY